MTVYKIQLSRLMGTREAARELLRDLPGDLVGADVLISCNRNSSVSLSFVDELAYRLFEIHQAGSVGLISPSPSLEETFRRQSAAHGFPNHVRRTTSLAAESCGNHDAAQDAPVTSGASADVRSESGWRDLVTSLRADLDEAWEALPESVAGDAAPSNADLASRIRALTKERDLARNALARRRDEVSAEASTASDNTLVLRWTMPADFKGTVVTYSVRDAEGVVREFTAPVTEQQVDLP